MYQPGHGRFAVDDPAAELDRLVAVGQVIWQHLVGRSLDARVRG